VITRDAKKGDVMKSKISILLGVLSFLTAGVIASVPAQAVVLGVDFPSNDNGQPPNTYNLGWSFTANSNVTVIGLGNFFGNTFPQDQQVGLWDSGGNLLASTFVTNTDALLGSAPWRFAAITPVGLIAGQTYVVGGQGGADYAGAIGNAIFAPQISYITDLYTDNGSGVNAPLVEPTITEGVYSGWYGGNIEIAQTPLPSTWTMLIAGFVGFGFLAYRGTKKGSAAIAAA
jgi:hypothetical protein